MARTLEVRFLSGVSLTVEVIARGTNVVTETITMTELSVAKMTYQGTIGVGTAAGDYDLNLVVSTSRVALTDVTIGATDGVTYNAPIDAAKENTDYPDDCVMLDPVNGTAGTTVGTHGTARNPSLTFADAATIAAARGRNHIRFVPYATVTVASGTFGGYAVDLNGGGLSLNNAANFTSGSKFYTSLPAAGIGTHFGTGQSVVDLDTGNSFQDIRFSENLQAADYCYLKRCVIGTLSTAFTFAILGDNGTDPVSLENCYTEKVSGLTFDVGGGADLILNGWYGDFTVANMVAGQTVLVYGYAKVTLAASCTGGTFRHTLHVEVTDNSGGAVTKDLVSEPGTLTVAYDPAKTAATQTSVNAIDDFVDTEITAILALLDDTRTEPGQGAPPANPDAMTKIDYLYKAWRNKKTKTATASNLYNDAGTTVDQKTVDSDDATTGTRGEWTTGP